MKQQGGITGKGFVKGDPRINRKGRPRSFDALRALAQQIAHEPITEVNGHKATVAEMILRKWASSNNPILQRAFIEVAFGKVPDTVQFGEDHFAVTIVKGNLKSLLILPVLRVPCTFPAGITSSLFSVR